MEINFQLCIKCMPQFGKIQKDTHFTMDMIETRIVQDIRIGTRDLPFNICRTLWKNEFVIDI